MKVLEVIARLRKNPIWWEYMPRPVRRSFYYSLLPLNVQVIRNRVAYKTYRNGTFWLVASIPLDSLRRNIQRW